MTDHPIVPPPELLEKWSCDLEEDMSVTIAWDEDLFCKIARWGADQELEACCEWVAHILDMPGSAICLREDRRPKPPSLKKQALTALHAVATGANDTREQYQDLDTIRRALEQLDD